MTDLLESISSPLADAAVRGCLLLAATALMALALKNRSAALRQLVWNIGLLTVLALPVASALLPSWAWLPAPAIIPDAPSGIVFSGTATMTAPAPPQATAPSDLNLPAILTAIWALGALLLIARLAFGQIRLSRRSKNSNIPPALAAHAEQLRHQFGISRQVRLTLEPEGGMPTTWGFFRPAIALPADSTSWKPERLRAVLSHELAHIARLDAATQWLAHLACALHWFNPLAWLAAHRTQVERELACDDAVILNGSPAHEYAEQLLRIVTGARPNNNTPTTIAMAKNSKIEHRITSILRSGTDRRQTGRRTALSLTIIGLAAALPIAIITGQAIAQEKKQPTAEAPQSIDLLFSPDGKKVVIHNLESLPTLTHDELAKHLAKNPAHTKLPTRIVAPKGTPYRQVTAVLNILSAAKVEDVSFVAASELKSTPPTRTPPAGRYAVNLLIDNVKIDTEFIIKGDTAECVKSTKAPGERELKGARGKFSPGPDNKYALRIHGIGYTATQIWEFQPDGTANVKEIPDRGENQRAVPIKSK